MEQGSPDQNRLPPELERIRKDVSFLRDQWSALRFTPETDWRERIRLYKRMIKLGFIIGSDSLNILVRAARYKITQRSSPGDFIDLKPSQYREIKVDPADVKEAGKNKPPPAARQSWTTATSTDPAQEDKLKDSATPDCPKFDRDLE
jgi:hypothetical protein